MANYYLAVDIGASSGRHILGSLQDGKLALEEMYRFENRLVERGGCLCWDLEHLFHEIVAGMKKCGEAGKIPVSMGIDTWAVDFVLLDERDRLLGDTVAYRDGRTTGMDEIVAKKIPMEELYARTGIQKQIFNTIYQLTAVQKAHPEQLEQAKSFLMVPEYFNFLLTGVKMNEYTNATTTQLVNAQTNTWDFDLIARLGLPTNLFGDLFLPKTLVGPLREEIKRAVGFDCNVVLPATHDTGSAVLAVPANDDDYIYISSGTWSLMGVESKTANCSRQSMEMNFTNEGGYDYRFRYLKNIMGLWIIQSIKRELNNQYTFDQLCGEAMAASGFSSRIDVNDGSFLAPEEMIGAVKDYCKKSGQPVPQTVGELMACVYNSLAQSYGETVRQLEQTTGRTYRRLHIVGGGTKDVYLNKLTAQYTGKEVYAGPTEATALGNLLAQMLRAKEFDSLEAARTTVAKSFAVRRVE